MNLLSVELRKQGLPQTSMEWYSTVLLFSKFFLQDKSYVYNYLYFEKFS